MVFLLSFYAVAKQKDVSHWCCWAAGSCVNLSDGCASTPWHILA